MHKTLFLAITLTFFAFAGYSQQTPRPANDTLSKKGSHQVKTVNTKVIKIDKPAFQNNKPLPPMKTRHDTLMYLIQQHKQNQKNTK